MNESEKYAEDLIQLIGILRDGQDTPRPSNLDQGDVALVKDLVSLAQTLKPDPSFSKELKERLLHANRTEQRSIEHSISHSVIKFRVMWRNTMIQRRKRINAAGLIIVLVIGAFVVAPVLAQFALAHFAPREAETWSINSDSVVLATIPAESYSRNVEALEKKAGFSALMPQYVPSNCYFRESYYLDEPIGEIHLIYDDLINHLPCFDVTQRETEGNLVHRPYVGADSTEEITIKGKPALYINGIWWIDTDENLQGGSETTRYLSPKEQEKLFGKATWIEGHQQLVFEYNGLLIRIDAESNISKEELMKVAESME